MIIEIIHNRLPDATCEHTVFVDDKRIDGDVILPSVALTVRGGLPVVFESYDIDPGAGYSLDDWQEATEHDCAKASPAVAEQLRSLRDDIAKTSEYVDRSCAASFVNELLDEGRANDAGISLRFQCGDCGTMLSSADKAHDQPVVTERGA